jgi:hypothetical protein
VDPLKNHYHRGPFHYIQEIIAYGYFVSACILLVYETIKEMHNITHIKHTAVFMYVFIPFIAGIVSYIFPGVEIIWQAASISLLVAFYNMQIEQISVAALSASERLFASKMRLARLITMYGDCHTALSEVNWSAVLYSI